MRLAATEAEQKAAAVRVFPASFTGQVQVVQPRVWPGVVPCASSPV